MKLGNPYAKVYPDFDKAPKTVIAAVAYSLAQRLCCDGDDGDAQELLRSEWQTLYENGIVPQNPRNT